MITLIACLLTAGLAVGLTCLVTWRLRLADASCRRADWNARVENDSYRSLEFTQTFVLQGFDGRRKIEVKYQKPLDAPDSDPIVMIIDQLVRPGRVIERFTTRCPIPDLALKRAAHGFAKLWYSIVVEQGEVSYRLAHTATCGSSGVETNYELTALGDVVSAKANLELCNFNTSCMTSCTITDKGELLITLESFDDGSLAVWSYLISTMKRLDIGFKLVSDLGLAYYSTEEIPKDKRYKSVELIGIPSDEAFDKLKAVAQESGTKVYFDLPLRERPEHSADEGGG